ncbi:MAG TPA: MFS transporter [Jatrophihabitans sp.]|nr:MFS transporter [Jatrophihabitans sp.]
MTTDAPALPRPLSPTVDVERPPAAGPVAGPALSPAGLATVLLGTMLPIVDFFIVNVALPTMARDLHASTAILELVVSGYATAYAVLLVVGGRLGDRWGRRRMFLTGMAAFTLASLLCGIAPTAGLLVAARIVQGAAAAAMVPQVLSTIQATGDATSRARALGWFGATGGIAAVTGQVLGGALVSANIAGTGWRPIFLVNVPIGMVGLWFASRQMPETRSPRPARPDGAGALLLAATLVAVLLPLTEGRALGWPWWSAVLLGALPFAAGAFVAVERRIERSGREPLVPPSLVAHHSMRRGLLLAVPFFAGFGAFMFVFALVMQESLHFGAAVSGLALAPMAIAFLLASLAMPRLIAAFGRDVITTGALLQGVGIAGLALTLGATWPHVAIWQLAPALTVMGAGQGLVMPSLFRVVLAEVPIRSAGAGSGVLTTTQQVSLAVGVATLGTLFVSLAAPGSLGTLAAALVVLGVQVLASAAVAIGSRWLPRGV